MNNATFAYFARKYFNHNKNNAGNPVDFIKEVIGCVQDNKDSNSDTVQDCVDRISYLIEDGKCKMGEPTKLQDGRTACLINFPGKGDIVIWYKEANKAYKNALRDYGEGYGRVKLGFVLNDKEQNVSIANKLKELCAKPLPDDLVASNTLIQAISCIQDCK